MANKNTTAKRIALALQGGGAHGAFTWGVLDKLLEDGRFDLAAISGTSAGAMNAAVLTQGHVSGGRDGARQSLEDFWLAVSRLGAASPIRRSLLDMVTGNWSMDQSPAYNWFDLVTRVVSPYESNPLDINPLLELIERTIDFEKVRSCSAISLFVSATNVRNGKIKVFEGHELTAATIMASACLPKIYRAVEIDGEHYWDGGFMGNPPIFPVFYKTDIADIILVQINPIERAELPRTARDIDNRLNEITFNSSLLRELRAIHFVTRLIDDGKLDQSEYTRAHLHQIECSKRLNPLSASSKLNTEWPFLLHLRDIGRETAEEWLEQNADKVGVTSTLDLPAMFD